MNDDLPISLYLVTPPGQIKRLSPLFRMIVTLIIDKLTASMEFKDGKPIKGYKHRLLLLLDEFPALGTLDKVQDALAFVAGYGIKVMPIIQDLNQLYAKYTKNTSIMGNSHIQVYHTPTDLDTKKYLSESLGDKTEVVENNSYSGDRFNFVLKNESTHTTESARRLLDPAEVGELSGDKEIIFQAGARPILAKKLRYFNDNNFNCRVLAAPAKSDIIRPVLQVNDIPGAASQVEVAFENMPVNVQAEDTKEDILTVAEQEAEKLQREMTEMEGHVPRGGRIWCWSRFQ